MTSTSDRIWALVYSIVLISFMVLWAYVPA